MKLVDPLEERFKDDRPYAERILEEEAAIAEKEAARMKLIMADLQKRHELELQSKIEELNSKYRQSMKKWIIALVVILSLVFIGSAFVIVQLFSSSHGEQTAPVQIDTNDLKAAQEKLKVQKMEISEMEDEIEATNIAIAELSTKYFETNQQEYLDRMNEKKAEYEKLYTQYTEKVKEYNALNTQYKKKAGGEGQ